MQPLADKMRPLTLDEYIGQEHVVKKGAPLYEAMQKKYRFSFILWGPPGVGKTTLARIYARGLDATLFELSAVSAGKTDIKKVLAHNVTGAKILFLDEIHRFNKAQQDFLLPYVEAGDVTLIGATTENPSFEVIPALLSRCRVFTLNALDTHELVAILTRAYPSLQKSAGEWIAERANGDARQALSILEHTLATYGTVTTQILNALQQDLYVRYDKHTEEHHNTVSAFIKSMRAGQPDATLYYLARMIEGGEDPKFIARRMIIFASEDVGLAQPTALVVANEVFRACETIGLPECRINLAHGAVYLAQAKKDRRVYDGIERALKDVKQYGNLSIPLNIRNAPTKLMKQEGYGKDYNMYDTKSYPPEKLNRRTYLE